MYIVQRTDKSGMYHKWNLSLYMDYRRANPSSIETGSMSEHPLIGRRYLYRDTIVEIVAVKKNWHGGFYLDATFKDENDSHGVVVAEIISCIDPVILNEYEVFLAEFNPI